MPMPAAVAKIEEKAPTLLTPAAVIASCLYGLVLAVPVLVAMLVVSVREFGAPTFLIPLIVIAAATFFLPLGFGNPHIVKLVRRLPRAADAAGEAYIVQLTRIPRTRSGLLAILEDADDIGLLQLTDAALIFNGDSIRLTVPYEQISNLRLRSAGWRAMFAYGAQTVFSVTSLPAAGGFIFAERSSWLLPTSRKTARRIYRQLCEKLPGSSDSAILKS